MGQIVTSNRRSKSNKYVIDREDMGREEMGREEMGGEEMGGEDMDREEMNREEMNREEMGREDMNHFTDIGVVALIDEPKTPTQSVLAEKNVYRKKVQLSIRTNMCSVEVSFVFKEALRHAEKINKSTKYDYYKIYLKHLFGSCKKMHEKIKMIKELKESVSLRLLSPQYLDKIFVKKTMNDNMYFYKSVRPGIVVKLFHTQYNHSDVIIKTYIFDQHCDYVSQTMEENFRDEVTFQLYASKLNIELDFISPQIYSWGKICRYKYPTNNCWFSCLYIIMEYIPHLTLNKCNFSKENMKEMYKKVNNTNDQLMQHMIHHNDLHGNNIMVNPESEKVILLDFGESKLGPTKPLFL